MAKAVRIRIESGGKTHGDLESLLRAFSIEDVKNRINEGKLARWISGKAGDELIEDFNDGIPDHLDDRDGALRFCGRFFRKSGNKEIRGFWGDGNDPRGAMGEFIHMLLNTPGYEESAFRIWMFSFPTIKDEDFEKILEGHPKEIFERLKSFHDGGNHGEQKHPYIRHWLGLCCFKGAGTDRDLKKAEEYFKDSLDNTGGGRRRKR